MIKTLTLADHPGVCTMYIIYIKNLQRSATTATAPGYVGYGDPYSPVHKGDAHRLTGLRGGQAGFSLLPWLTGTMLAHVPHTACFRSVRLITVM